MKKYLFLLFVAAFLGSCRQSPPNAELILGKWKGLNISMEPLATLPEQEKSQILMANQMIAEQAGQFEMEFSKDGSFTMKDAQAQQQKGTYALENEGKTMRITQPGLPKPYSVSIEKLSADTLIYLMKEFPDSNMTMMLKHVRYAFVK